MNEQLEAARDAGAGAAAVLGPLAAQPAPDLQPVSIQPVRRPRDDRGDHLPRPAPHVIELGAGTGAVTRQLIRNGVCAGKSHPGRTGRRARRRICGAAFPGVDVVVAPAQDLVRAVARAARGQPVGAVVSTLPMRLFPKPMIRSIVKSELSGARRPAGCSCSSPTATTARCRLRLATAMGLKARRRWPRVGQPAARGDLEL